MENFSITDHIGIFDGFFSEEFCDDLIKFFAYRSELLYVSNRNNPYQQDKSVSLGHEQDFVAHRQTDEQVFNALEAQNIIKFFSSIFWSKCFSEYMNHHSANEQIKNLGFNTVKIQKTLPGQGYHNFHFENSDMLTANRAMFFILYLNTVKEGGETEFLYQSKRIEPKIGRLIIAPATYTHPHRGNPPLSDTKYILTSWLEYSGNKE